MSSIGRISTYAMQQFTLRNAAQVQDELFNLQTQLSSGYRAQDFAGLGGGGTEQYLQLEGRVSKIQVYLDSNKLVETRLSATNTAVDQVISTATDVKNLILLRRNDSIGNSLAFSEQLENYWKTICSQLNVNSEGRYIFSGTRTDTPPVDTSSFPALESPPTPDDGYYRGSSEDTTARLDDNVEITYNVRANDSGFQKVFAGLAMAKRGDDTKNPDDLKTAYDLVEEGVKDIIGVQATVNANKVLLGQINEQHQGLQLYWKGIKEDIANTDIVSASTQVALNQGILQASFQTFAKINSLRLTDFLR